MKNTYKTILLFALTLLIVGSINAQFNWQGAIRTDEGQPLNNQDVNLLFTIYDNGVKIYEEEQSLITNEYGITVATICFGTPRFGDCTNFDFSNGIDYQLEVGIDLEGGSNYESLGISYIDPVPQALHARLATHVINDQVEDGDANSENEIQSLTLQGNELSISEGNTVTLPMGESFDNWSLNGNVETGDNTFFGTTDGAGISFRTNNLERMYLSSQNGELTIYGDEDLPAVIQAASLGGYKADLILSGSTTFSGPGGNVALIPGIGNVVEGFGTGSTLIDPDNLSFTGIGMLFPEYRLDVNGSTRFVDNGTGEDLHIIIDTDNSAMPSVRPFLSSTGSVGTAENYWLSVYTDTYYGKNMSIQSFSDLRLKENIRPMESALDKINQINCLRYDYKKEFYNPSNSSRINTVDYHDVMGFSAQQVETIFPEIVKVEPTTEMKTVGYASLIPALVKAIQEQQEMINDLQSQITSLKASIASEE